MTKYPRLVAYVYDGSIDNLPATKFSESEVPGPYKHLNLDKEDLWIPVRDSENEWIQLGNLVHNRATLHSEVGYKPSWGVNHDFSENRKYLMIRNGDTFSIIKHETVTWKEAYQKYGDKLISAAEFCNIFNVRIKFIKKFLGKMESSTTTNLRGFFENCQNILMKLDIEGGENELFKSFSDSDLLKIKQLVIEFHSSHQKHIPTRLAKTHNLVHFHANNYSHVDVVDGLVIPNVFECTYLRKDLFDNKNISLNNVPIPDPEFDQKNNPNAPEITLNCPPYCHK